MVGVIKILNLVSSPEFRPNTEITSILIGVCVKTKTYLGIQEIM